MGELTESGYSGDGRGSRADGAVEQNRKTAELFSTIPSWSI